MFPRRREKKKKSTTYQIVEFFVIVALSIAAALAVQKFLFRPYTIPSGSMIPTLVEGQRIIANRTVAGEAPQLGDVLVFNPPSGVARETQCAQLPRPDSACAVAYPDLLSETYIKRVVGLPGDRVAMRAGRIIRNGELADEPFINNSCPAEQEGCSWSRPVVIPAGHYYMIGDNRGDSQDSRFWGPLPQKAITGKAVATYWPPSRLGPLD